MRPNQRFQCSLMLLAVCLACFVSSCSPKRGHRDLKLAHGLDPSHPVHQAMVFMAHELDSISGGRLTMTIYPSAQLGSEQQCVEMLQIGSLAMTKVSSAVLEGFTDNFQVLGLPYIFRSKAHQFKVLDGPIGQGLLESVERYKIKGLCFYDAGARSFYTTNKSIQTLGDLKGLKIRVMKSPTAMRMVEAMGASPTPISFGELYTALQSGVVDGAENNPPSFATSMHYEVCKHYTLDEHTMVPDVLIVSTVVWNGLSDQEKTWLQTAAQASVGVERRLWAESEEESLAKVKAAGVEVLRVDKKPFIDAVQPFMKTYENKPALYKLILEIENVKE